MPQTFMQQCLNGRASPDDIETFTDRWHRIKSEVSLSEYLGMTNAEYRWWVEAPSALPRIVQLRREHRDQKTKKPKKEEVKPGDRVCLKCNKKFRSSGPGNRICRECVKTNEVIVRRSVPEYRVNLRRNQ